MGSMGISPRPTVSQWLQQKREQKKAVTQDALISWDRYVHLTSQSDSKSIYRVWDMPLCCIKLYFAYLLCYCVSVWYRDKERREAAILLQQALTSQRAMKHAAWGAKKEISAKLKALKDPGMKPKGCTSTLQKHEGYLVV